jgi:hypothetical protein
VITAATQPIVGADADSRFVLGLIAGQLPPSWAARYGDVSPIMEIASVNGQTGLVVRLGGRAAMVVAFGVADGRIALLDLVVNPDKLDAWPTA